MSKITDPIADMLTRIRNGQQAKHAHVRIPGSKMKLAIAEILQKYGYIESVAWRDEGPQGQIDVALRYDKDKMPMIKNITRVSKSSRRVYVGVGNIPKVLNGLGISIISTSKGVVSDREARAQNMGGEIICSVY